MNGLGVRFLIVTADDFGLHTAVNSAVELAKTRGILTAASLMVGAPAAADAIRRARRLPDLRVGLHVVLTDGQSVLPHAAIPDLVDVEGRFRNSMVRDGVRFFALPHVRLQLEAEIRAQFKAFAASGLRLDHVNAHKHFHVHPTLLNLILRIGREFGLRAVRIPFEPPFPHAPFFTRATSALLAPWIGSMRRRLRAGGIACNDQLYGLSFTGRMDEGRLLSVLEVLPRGVTEIYLHPAEATEDILCSEPGYRHEDELSGLLSQRVQAALRASEIRCGGYSDLVECSLAA